MRSRSIVLSILAGGTSLAGCHEAPQKIPPPPPGICASIAPVTLQSLAGKQLGPTLGLVVWVDRSSIIAAELVGGGGGGGGSPGGADQTKWGDGGKHAVFVRESSLKVSRGHYILRVGNGGEGGAKYGWTEPGKYAPSGGATTLSTCKADVPIVSAPGGAGGLGGGIERRPVGSMHYAGNGEDLADPVTHAPVGNGGQGGYWQTNGSPASGNGAGGGGQGGWANTDDARHGGPGSDGYAKLTRIGR